MEPAFGGYRYSHVEAGRPTGKLSPAALFSHPAERVTRAIFRAERQLSGPAREPPSAPQHSADGVLCPRVPADTHSVSNNTMSTPDTLYLPAHGLRERRRDL